MRLFRYEITMNVYYPFGDSDYYTIKDIVQVNDVNDELLSDEEIKDKLINKLELPTKYKEEAGHEHVVSIELKPILVI